MDSSLCKCLINITRRRGSFHRSWPFEMQCGRFDGQSQCHSRQPGNRRTSCDIGRSTAFLFGFASASAFCFDSAEFRDLQKISLQLPISHSSNDAGALWFCMNIRIVTSLHRQLEIGLGHRIFKIKNFENFPKRFWVQWLHTNMNIHINICWQTEKKDHAWKNDGYTNVNPDIHIYIVICSLLLILFVYSFNTIRIYYLSFVVYWILSRIVAYPYCET